MSSKTKKVNDCLILIFSINTNGHNQEIKAHDSTVALLHIQYHNRCRYSNPANDVTEPQPTAVSHPRPTKTRTELEDEILNSAIHNTGETTGQRESNLEVFAADRRNARRKRTRQTYRNRSRWKSWKRGWCKQRRICSSEVVSLELRLRSPTNDGDPPSLRPCALPSPGERNATGLSLWSGGEGRRGRGGGVMHGVLWRRKAGDKTSCIASRREPTAEDCVCCLRTLQIHAHVHLYTRTTRYMDIDK